MQDEGTKPKRRHSAETRAKLSAAAKRRYEDPEERRKASEARKGIPRPPEVVARVSAALTGRKLSPEHRARLSEIRTGREVTPAMRAQYDALSGEGHHAWKGEGASHAALHQWLAAHFAKTGVCEDCGRPVGTDRRSGTEWAFLRHPEPHTRHRDDYKELCKRCHRRMDHEDRIERLVRERLKELLGE